MIVNCSQRFAQIPDYKTDIRENDMPFLASRLGFNLCSPTVFHRPTLASSHTVNQHCG